MAARESKKGELREPTNVATDTKTSTICEKPCPHCSEGTCDLESPHDIVMHMCNVCGRSWQDLTSVGSWSYGVGGNELWKLGGPLERLAWLATWRAAPSD